MSTFSIGEHNYSEGHKIGDKQCRKCWYKKANPCKNCDGGLVHTCFADENYDGCYWLWYECDKCGSNDINDGVR